MDGEIEQVVSEWKIAKLLTHWVNTRDTMDLHRHLELWAPDGTMHVGFFSGSCQGFMQAVIENGADTRHFMGTPLIEVRGNHARADTYVLLMARIEHAPGPLVLLAHLRFHDMLLKVDGEWRLHKRYVVFEKDRIDFVAPCGWKGLLYKVLQLAMLRHYKPQARHLSFVWDYILKTGSPPRTPYCRQIPGSSVRRAGTGLLAVAMSITRTPRGCPWRVGGSK